MPKIDNDDYDDDDDDDDYDVFSLSQRISNTIGLRGGGGAINFGDDQDDDDDADNKVKSIVAMFCQV